jgi:predicted porin
MLKSVATVAALAGLATGAAAQSSAVLFGLVDLSAQYLRSGDRSALGGAHTTRLADGVIYGPGSRWGIRATEDLGGGAVAFVLLEAGFSADTGTLGQGAGDSAVSLTSD